MIAEPYGIVLRVTRMWTSDFCILSLRHMAYGDPRFRKAKIATFGLLLSAIAVVLIGPFTFFPALWPHLSPVLPRPEAVPEGATAGYHWKASGTYWQWEEELQSGCALWSSSGGERSYITLDFATGDSGCAEATRRFGFFYSAGGRADVSFHRAGSNAFSCSRYTTDLTEDELTQMAMLLEEAKARSITNGQRLVIAYAEQFISQPEPAPGEHPCREHFEKRSSD